MKSEAPANKATLKLNEKDLKNVDYKLERKQNDLQTKLNEFQEYKAVKRSEEKESKSKEERLEKKLRAVEEREATLKVERSEFDKTPE